MSSSSSTNPNPKPPGPTDYPPAPTNGHDHPTAVPFNGHDPAIATGYPYYPNPNPNPNPYYYNSNPNPNPNPNPYYYPQNPNPNPNRSIFLRRLIIITIAVFIAIGAVTFIIYLVLRPRFPYFALSSLSVSSISVASSNSLSSSISLSFTVQNPNSKLSISYDDVAAQVYVSGNPFVSTHLAPFSQVKHNTTVISATLAAAGAFVGADAVDSVKGGRGLGMDVELVAVARFWSGAWRMRRYGLKGLCRDVAVGLKNGTTMTGSMTGGPRQCMMGAWRLSGF